MFMSIFFLFIISMLFMLISFFLSNKMYYSIEKQSAFECGFNSFFKLRMPFSIRFFLISLIFLIFDIEILIVLPVMFFQNMSLSFFYSIFILMFIILYGLFHEWIIGSLDWIL